MKKYMPLLIMGIVVAFAGCTMIPRYSRPAMPGPAQWPTGAAYQEIQAATYAPKASELKWDEFFTDKKIRQVVETALTNNLDLRLAVLNVERARAMYGIQRAGLLPSVNAVGSGSKQRIPADLSSTGERMTSERYDVNLGVAAWEVDLFGRIRSLKDSALEQYLATEQARRGAQILLVSSVAGTYLNLTADREKLKLAETTLEAQKSSYDLIKKSEKLGVIPEIDLHRAQTQVDVARGDVARFTQLVAQDRNALNLLVGTPVPDELLPTELGTVAYPKEIGAGVPSEILLCRPDVLQAENLLKSANADIGAARAAFFPRIALTAAFGSASSELDGLFKSGSSAWSFTPQIVMPIFDARTWSAHKVAKAQREIAVTQYEKAIQTAFREVADTLAVRGSVDKQLSAQESLVHAVAETYRLSQVRYNRGIDSYLNVLDAQRSLYAAQQGMVSLRLAKIANQIRLYAVLGGGGNPAGEKTGK
ncbi:MAG: efflux transporter outer membrane subunit [Kiritimatiellae bacterium]|nr:efflux transporter outer membrane subunit [Kiritimatiellia bacterium]MDD5523089.1 efflux transporter outer membrane subunit [Kiritimatiellia bacterium]